jgi:hypothetical protein
MTKLDSKAYFGNGHQTREERLGYKFWTTNRDRPPTGLSSPLPAPTRRPARTLEDRLGAGPHTAVKSVM